MMTEGDKQAHITTSSEVEDNTVASGDDVASPTRNGVSFAPGVIDAGDVDGPPAAAAATPSQDMRQRMHKQRSMRSVTNSIVKMSEPNQDGLVRMKIAEERQEEETKLGLGFFARKRLQLQRCFQRGDNQNKKTSDTGRLETNGTGGMVKMSTTVDSNDDDDVESGAERGQSPQSARKQYRITSRQSHADAPGKGSRIDRLRFSFLSAIGLAYDPDSDALGPILAYLSWTFRASFSAVFISMLFFFMTWVTAFAAFLALGGRNQPQCVYVSGSEFYDVDKQGSFSDVFQLSWTTFSTVGYGSVFPSTSVQTQTQQNCSFVQFLCTLEAFVGVLYAGFCGAVLFGKVSRVQSRARVVFSDPICVRYGRRGVEYEKSAEDDDCYDVEHKGAEEFDGGSKSAIPSKVAAGSVGQSNIPCPVLEFRIINERCNLQGGEIVDASLTCVSSIVTDVSSGENISGSISERGVSESDQDIKADHPSSPTAMTTTKKVSARRIFSKLDIETAEHPFFQRVWNVRHVLDANSSLLKGRVKKLIERNGGYWPMELNSAQGVRDSLRFSQIIVSFSGVSNITASSVYEQKIYDFVDINVGYQFAPVLYRKVQTNKLSVDKTMINDVLEQNGGGAEALD